MNQRVYPNHSPLSIPFLTSDLELLLQGPSSRRACGRRALNAARKKRGFGGLV
jgi:hypothetical protein